MTFEHYISTGTYTRLVVSSNISIYLDTLLLLLLTNT